MRSFTEIIIPVAAIRLVLIPGGSFLMGAFEPSSKVFQDELPQHEVNIKTFFMSKDLITQAQWRSVASLPRVRRVLQFSPSYFKGDNLPVESVSWYDAVEFCERLSVYTGRSYRLPSEAEWEYVAGADGKTYAKTYSRTGTTEVYNLPTNAFGIRGIQGNLEQWCQDTWHKGYEGAPTDGSAWVDEGILKVVRGDSWQDHPDDCSLTYRDGSDPEYSYSHVGFRIACDMSSVK